MSSSVLLGAIDEPIKDFKTDWSTNKTGGQPDWITKINNPNCQECGNRMLLVVQLYCPLGGSSYHRTLYLFTCIKDSRWTLIRQQKHDDSSLQKVAKHSSRIESSDDCGVDTNDWGPRTDDWGAGANDWGDGANDWGTGANNLHSDTNVLEAETEKEEHVSCKDSGKDVQQMALSEQESYVPDGSNDGGCISKLDPKDPLITENIDVLTSDLSSMEVENIDHSLENKSQSFNVIVEDNMINTERVNCMMSILEKSADGHVTGFSDEHSLLSYYVNVMDESEDDVESRDVEHVEKLLKVYQKELGAMEDNLPSSLSGGGSSSGEKYEKSSFGDKYFHKFLKRIGRLPEQIIRYEWNGSPLFICKPDDVLSMATRQTCKHCGSGLVFELQIMPALINFLQFEDVKETGIEYGTVIIYTCKASCWTDSDSHRYEHVFIQLDPDQHHFKQALSNKIAKK